MLMAKAVAKKARRPSWSEQKASLSGATMASMMLFVARFFEMYGDSERTLHSMEMFSGKQAITKKTRNLGFKCVALDKTYSSDDTMDLTTSRGFDYAMQMAFKLR